MKRWLMVILGALACHGALADDLQMPLKSGAGDGAANANCNVCHTSNYIVMNSLFLTPDGWKAEVTKMRSAFGAPIDDATAAEITSYLADHYAIPPRP